MSIGTDGAVLRQFERLYARGKVGGLSEEDLLERYVDNGDEAAFEAIVTRFGPMVLSVCQRHLDDQADVEDAF